MKLFSYDSLVRPALTRVPATIADSKPWSHEIRYFELAHRREEYDARGTRTTFDLDKLGRVVRIRDLYDKTVETTYDGVGNKLTEKDKRGFVTHFEYDPLNRLILVRDPLEQTIETSFDDSQNRRVEKDKRLISRLTQADALGRVVRVVRPYDRVKDEGIPLETHAYDGDNNRLSSTDAESREAEDAIAASVDQRLHKAASFRKRARTQICFHGYFEQPIWDFLRPCFCLA